MATVLKFAPYLGALMVGLMLGAWSGYRYELGTAMAAEAALADQKAANAQAVAQANAQAATMLSAAERRANLAEAALAAQQVQAQTGDQALTVQIAAEAQTTGDDGPVAPVLAHTLDALRSGK